MSVWCVVCGVCVCVWGGVELQSCSQHCTGRMGDVSVVCVGGGGGGRTAVMQSTLHWEEGDLSLSLFLSLSLSKVRILFLPVLFEAGKQKGLGSIPLRLSFPALQKGCGLWTLSCDFVPHN